MTQSEFEAAVLAEGYDAPVHIERPVGYSLGIHQHPFDAWALITAGDITLVVNGAATRYAAGECFRLPAGTDHEEGAGPDGVAYISARRERTAA